MCCIFSKYKRASINRRLNEIYSVVVEKENENLFSSRIVDPEKSILNFFNITSKKNEELNEKPHSILIL